MALPEASVHAQCNQIARHKRALLEGERAYLYANKVTRSSVLCTIYRDETMPKTINSAFRARSSWLLALSRSSTVDARPTRAAQQHRHPNTRRSNTALAGVVETFCSKSSTLSCTTAVVGHTTTAVDMISEFQIDRHLEIDRNIETRHLGRAAAQE